MIPHPKKPVPLSFYERQLLQIVDKYQQETGETEPHLFDVARWGRIKGLLEVPSVDVDRINARILARVCRKDYIEDENGEPVRHRHAVKEDDGKKQRTLWPKMEDITPAKMKVSLQSRRNGMLQDALQIERDRRYFNKHYNAGDPIDISHDLSIDVEEHFLPAEYPEEPPDENQGDS
jgi:hypothetical protein